MRSRITIGSFLAIVVAAGWIVASMQRIGSAADPNDKKTPTSYMPVVVGETFDSMRKRMEADKPEDRTSA